ncbi:MAG: hypothetical protein HYY04_07545 [Chloroflexi bacterium]|nr:hypothetical protein [Chloroflexota bacterium]
MKIFDILLGRARPARSQLDRLFAISTAQLTLTTELHLRPGERAGICFRPLSSARFAELRGEIEQLLQLSARTSGTVVQTELDAYGFQWALMQDPDFEDLVTTIHMVSLSLEEQGVGDRLLAALFKFFDESQPVYWVYNYKRASYYPFVPTGANRRDSAAELRLAAVMKKELPVEADQTRWFPLWGAPV